MIVQTKKSKFLSAEEAVSLIPDEATVAVAGFRFAGSAEELLQKLGQRFKQEGHPRYLTVVFSSAQGDSDSRGLDHLAQKGMLRRVIGGFFGVTPRLTRLILDNQIEAYNMPQGQLTRLYHAIAARQPGHLSDIGLETFVDPRQEGGRLNAKTTQDIVDVVRIAGKEMLLYKSFPVDFAFLRGTTADERGNITMENEAVKLEVLPLAMAVKNSGGKVMVQVERRVPAETLHPKDIELPGYLVDVVVVSNDPEKNHAQTLGQRFNPAFCGQARMPRTSIPPLNLNERKVIARRAARELKGGEVVNLGSGIPEGIGSVLAEESRLEQVYLSLESGVNGGIPETQPDFGVSTNPEVILRADDQFAFYNGGGLDVTFLGFAQIDQEGNVNVSRFSGNLVGCGGFLDITQHTKKVVFCGTFNSGGLQISLMNSKLNILRQGAHRKFISRVEQVTFSGRYATRHAQKVLFITERCVFELQNGRLHLKEVAPGVDVQRDILNHMDFKPVISPDLTSMPEECFR
ncbi:MAG: acyl CoA:acetate/3-ketoacid CoA transferase [Elusimicrobia bacterium]|nr:acyl CoA:acetate/3-ketoacid CoA transferase [Elusimicrobiota bacterium]